MKDSAELPKQEKFQPSPPTSRLDFGFGEPDDHEPYDVVHDKRDMRRLGRRQEVKRRFRYFSIVGYMVVLAATWESALIRYATYSSTHHSRTDHAQLR